MKRKKEINIGFMGILLSLSVFIIMVIVYWLIIEVDKREKLKSYNDCEPYFITSKKVEGDNVQITWGTKEKCSGYVKYGYNYNDLDYYSYPEGFSISKEKSVKIKYDTTPTYFVIISGEVEYGIDSFPIEISDLF